MTPPRRPRVVVLYHYQYPDDVVSARHFDDLCTGLHQAGWDVTARPCNRGCRDESIIRAPADTHPAGWSIRRVWRPAFRQASTFGRLANTAWMLAAWAGEAFRRGPDRPDVVLVGTDPVFGVLTAIPVKLFARRVRVALWAFDLHPEAAIAEGMSPGSLLVRLLRPLLTAAYRACDLIADLGPCMRGLLAGYGPRGKAVTIPPWALSEPDTDPPHDAAIREDLFGSAALGLLYSGNFGRAHSAEEFLALARRLRGSPVCFNFSIRGNRADEFRRTVTADDAANVRFGGFVPEEKLASHLAAADIHLAALRPGWTGVVVPSKFFGSLAAGRPVLFAGESGSALARWIAEHRVGWVLDATTDPGGIDRTAGELRALAADPSALAELRVRCREVYRRHFSRAHLTAEWDRQLRALLPAGR